MAVFPVDTAKRIVLMSDGNDNMADVLAAARSAAADGIPIDVVPLEYRHRNEVYFERMLVPAHVEPGEQVPVRMILRTHLPMRGTIAVYHNGEPVALADEDARVRLRPGANTFYIKLPIRTSGSQIFEATFRPDDETMDAVARNNTASAFSFVSGTSRVLLISSNPAHDAPLVEALRSEQVEVEMRSTEDLGDFGLVQAMDYATIILANVPAASFTRRQQQALASYVKDMGSGLIMTGGDEAFGAGGWIGSPVEVVMPVSFEIKHKRIIPRGALVLILHSCEIPRGNYWGKETAKKSVDTISSRDYIGVLAYSYSPGGENWEVPLDLNTNRASVKAKIDRMQIGDMPDFGSTLQMAYDALTSGRGRDAAQKHVIILSDGDAQRPSAALLAAYEQARISVSTVGIGWGAHVNSATLSNIARRTGGTYYAARNPRQLPQIFSKESKVIRRPLIIDEPFQPQLLHAQSDLLAGIATRSEPLPPLGGMVLTSAKENPNVVVPIVRATDDGDDPVLAYWQHELGKAAAFTSGYWPAWGDAWTRWPKFAKFWAQLVRWSMRQETPANFDTSTRIEGNRGRIVIDALDKDAKYLDRLQLRSKVIGPDNEAIPLHFVQTGPGKYEAEFDAERTGQYLASVHVYDGGRSLGTIHTGLSLPFSPEYRDLETNEALLRQVAEITDGRWADGGPGQADVFRHDLQPTSAKPPAWEWILAWLVLPLFLLDVSVRRLASWLALSVVAEAMVLIVLLFGAGVRYGPWWGILGAILLAELVGWIIRFRYIGPLFDYMTHGVTALGDAGERSEAALGRLKSLRARSRDGLGAGRRSDARRSEEDGTAGPRAVAARRFDVEEAGNAQATTDLTEALGGAEASTGGSPKRRQPASEDVPPEEESATARLLRAKKRAKRDRRENE